MSLTEDEWWNNLEGDDVYINAFGVPPYDVNAVASFLNRFCDFESCRLVLDIGCGPGRLVNELADNFSDCLFVGVDVAETMINLAKKQPSGNIEVSVLDGYILPKFSYLYDAVYSVTVFQHLPEEVVRNYFHQVCELIYPEAVFIFSFAEGTADHFLSHQVSKNQLTDWLIDAGFGSVIFPLTPDSHPNWSWAVAYK